MTATTPTQHFYRGVRASIAWLHTHADTMNDPHAQRVLNSAAFSLGVDKPDPDGDAKQSSTLRPEPDQRSANKTSSPPSAEGLEPCPNPWCFSRAAPLSIKSNRHGWAVHCQCGVRTPSFADMSDATKEWNTRPAREQARPTPEPVAWVLMRNIQPHTVFLVEADAVAERDRQRASEKEWREQNAHMADVRTYWNVDKTPLAQPTSLRIGEGEDQGSDSGSPTSRRGSQITDRSGDA